MAFFHCYSSRCIWAAMRNEILRRRGARVADDASQPSVRRDRDVALVPMRSFFIVTSYLLVTVVWVLIP